jgi:amino acid adenylation domain-containing protein
MDADTVTYGELEAQSNQLARCLVDIGCRRGDRIALFLPKSPAAILSMLGVLKADCSYVPIDTSCPAPRVSRMLDAIEPRVILAARSACGLLDEVLARSVWCAAHASIGAVSIEQLCGEHFRSEFTRADWARYRGDPRQHTNGPNDAAHILFTSGSTGSPKGVVITHANVIHFVEWGRDYFGMKDTDRISGHPPLHFDLSTFDIYGTLAAGAQLHLLSPERSLLPNRLAEFIRDSELTQWFSVPSALAYMARYDVITRGDFPALKRLLWCGEAIQTATLMYWMKRLPHVVFTNLYGPTETTIASSYFTVPACPSSEEEQIPIGRACPGEELLLLDDDLQPVTPDTIGNLYVAGAGLSPGYWRDEERTAAAFLRDPRTSDATTRVYKTGDLGRIGRDGLFYFVGRADSQIKSRGYRIELGEIENALSTIRTVSECAVVGVPAEGFEGTAICCAYSPADDATVDPATLRHTLAASLPNYMLPSRWLALATLPKTANGKIDRGKLRGLFEGRAT